jgi:RND family efflux transporter MFP subunit
MRAHVHSLTRLATMGAIVALSHGCSPHTASEAATAPQVVVREIEVRDVDVEINSPIELRAVAEVEVGSKIAGYLETVLVDRGDRVTRGQLLATVRPSDQTAALMGARGSLMEAQAKSMLAKQMADRATKVHGFGGMSTQELEQATSGYRVARAQEAAAAAEVAGHTMKLEESKIVAPLDGVVTERRLHPGALVGQSATTPIVSVARTDVLRAIITVSERDAPRVRVGQTGRVDLDALPGVVINGRVARVSPTLDSATRTCQVELWISNFGGKLMPGLYGRGTIIVDRHAQALVVPSTAIRVSNNLSWILVVRSNKIERREVTIGEDRGSWLEITKGVAPREEIVIAGADGISDGSAVQPVRGVNPFTGVPIAAAAPQAPAAATVNAPPVLQEQDLGARP